MMLVFSAVFRLLLVVLWTLLMLPPYSLALMLRRRYREIGMFYWRMVLRWCLLATVVVRGEQASQRPLLMVGNHAGYLDIVVLGSMIAGSFVSKAEVRSWPGIGILARLARTIFVDRRPSSTGRQRDEMIHRMHDGEPLILFPEGTSSDGNHVLPFKSALFTVAELVVDERAVAVQPFSIAYTRAGGLPVGYADRCYYAWYGDMELLPHLWDVLCRGPFEVEVTFLPPHYLSEFGNRKALARHCETVVRQGCAASLSGRADEA